MMYKSAALIVGVVGIVAYVYNQSSPAVELPVIADILWKQGADPNDDRIHPYSISVPKEVNKFIIFLVHIPGHRIRKPFAKDFP